MSSRTPSAIAAYGLFLLFTGQILAAPPGISPNGPATQGVPGVRVVAAPLAAHVLVPPAVKKPTNSLDSGSTAGLTGPSFMPPEGLLATAAPLLERARALRELLLDRPAERPANAALYLQVLRSLGAMVPVPARHTRKDAPPEPAEPLGTAVLSASDLYWTRVFILKGYVLLSLLDRTHEADHVRAAQSWLDQLVLDEDENSIREIGGLKVVFRGDPTRREIAMTVDGGPAEAEPALLDYLKQEDVKATFFLLGCFCKDAPAVCRRIPAEGHIVASHTMTHARWKGLARITEAQADTDIATGLQTISAATGVTHIELFRPPYGSGAELPRVCQIIARYHTYSIMWTIDTLDSMGAGLSRQINRVLESRRLNGAVILTHDHSKHVLELYQAIIPVLKRRGYRFVTVPELVAHAEERVRGQNLGEICVEVRDGQPGVAYQRALEQSRLASAKDPLASEALDLAYMVSRIFPGVAGPAGNKAQISSLVPQKRMP